MMKILNLIKSESEKSNLLTKPERIMFLTTPIVHQLVTHQNLPNVPLTVTPHPSATSSTFPPLDVNRLGVPQPTLVTKDILIIIFMLLFWAYSLFLTYRAYYKLHYSDNGEEQSNMWR